MIRKLHIAIIAILGLCSSCITHDELLNFSEGPPFPDSLASNIPDLTIQEDDLLSIRVMALDMEAALPFNVDPVGSTGVGGAGTNVSRPLIGYLVNKRGGIDFPGLGEIKVVGLTTTELKDMLIERLKPFLKDPVVLVRYINQRISILGEVERPGNLVLSSERLSILDAISSAGGPTPYANRRNVLVMREYNGIKEFGRVNLQSREIFNSPFFYLKQNDVIYVEPLKEKTAATRDQAQRILPWLSIVTSLTTLTLTIVNLSK